MVTCSSKVVGGMFFVSASIENERRLFSFPLGHLLDEEHVAFETGVADGADASALEHGLGRTREAQAMALTTGRVRPR